jgi:hypothetical protein
MWALFHVRVFSSKFGTLANNKCSFFVVLLVEVVRFGPMGGLGLYTFFNYYYIISIKIKDA